MEKADYTDRKPKRHRHLNFTKIPKIYIGERTGFSANRSISLTPHKSKDLPARPKTLDLPDRKTL